MMGMGNCCLGRANIRWQNTLSKVWDRKKGLSRHRYVSLSLHMDSQSLQAVGLMRLLDTHSWSTYSVLHLITVVRICACLCVSYPVMFLLYQV